MLTSRRPPCTIFMWSMEVNSFHSWRPDPSSAIFSFFPYMLIHGHVTYNLERWAAP